MLLLPSLSIGFTCGVALNCCTALRAQPEAAAPALQFVGIGTYRAASSLREGKPFCGDALATSAEAEPGEVGVRWASSNQPSISREGTMLSLHTDK